MQAKKYCEVRLHLGNEPARCSRFALTLAAGKVIMNETMTIEIWEKLPVEERKKLVEKRKAAARKYQGSLTILNPALK